MYLFIQLIIYSQIFGNFLYINSIGFPKVKFYVFEYSFGSFTMHVCVSVTYFHVCSHIPLYFGCACYLFVQDLCMFLHVLVCICVHQCVFVFIISRECVYIKYQTTRTLQQFQTVFKFPGKRRKCSTRCFLKGV